MKKEKEREQNKDMELAKEQLRQELLDEPSMNEELTFPTTTSIMSEHDIVDGLQTRSSAGSLVRHYTPSPVNSDVSISPPQPTSTFIRSTPMNTRTIDNIPHPIRATSMPHAMISPTPHGMLSPAPHGMLSPLPQSIISPASESSSISQPEHHVTDGALSVMVAQHGTILDSDHHTSHPHNPPLVLHASPVTSTLSPPTSSTPRIIIEEQHRIRSQSMPQDEDITSLHIKPRQRQRTKSAMDLSVNIDMGVQSQVEVNTYTHIHLHTYLHTYTH